MRDFKIDTPINIDELSEEDIALLCGNFGDVKSVKVRMRIIKLIYNKILKFDLSKDLLYALADESKYQFILALAGGGKTTTIVIKLALEKIYRGTKFTKSGKVKGDRILSLVYTKANVKDVIDRHTEIVTKINSLGVEGLQLDYDINCSTMHSFCLKWVIKEPTYREFLGLTGYELIDKKMQDSLITGFVEKLCKKEGIEVPRKVNVDAFLSLYNFMVETYSSLNDLKDTNLVIDTGIPVSIIEGTLKQYVNIKKLIRKYDYTDLLVKFAELMDTNEEAAERIKNYYDYITADEVQDFTPRLMDILKSIVGEHTMLTCIGDDDQSIYGFRGADNSNALNFKAIFPEAKIHLLRTNRRCPSNVLNLANNIISLNENRFKKEMLGIKGPGNIHFNGYNDRISQYMTIARLVKGMSDDDRSDCVIGYRDSVTSLALSILMYSNNQPFYVSRGYGPFDYGLFNHLITVLNALSSYNSKRKLLHLYKVLPVTKREMEEVLKYDRENDKFLDGKDYQDLDKLEFSPARMRNAKFVNLFKSLVFIARNMDTLPGSKYIPGLIGVIKTYSWDFLSSQSRIPEEIDSFCTEFVINFFNNNFTFKERYAYYLSEKRSIDGNKVSKKGACLCTFHSLKGLEFDNVILCDLAENIFPNYSGIDFRPYDEQTKKDLKEEENRLMYVAVTRSKKNLWFFYSKSDPSYYISFLKDESLNYSRMASIITEDGTEDSTEIEVLSGASTLDDSTQFVHIEEEPSNEVVITKDNIRKVEGIEVKARPINRQVSSTPDFRKNVINSLFNKK